MKKLAEKMRMSRASRESGERREMRRRIRSIMPRLRRLICSAEAISYSAVMALVNT